MIHEALFYLWNCPGDLFTMNNEEEWINSVDLQDFLHPGERKLLQRIMAIALKYHHIQEFIKVVGNQHLVMYEVVNKEADTSNIEVKPGLYVKAFCNGVDEVLDDYRKEIISLEDMLLKNPQLTLTYVLSCIEKFLTLFEALTSMINFIQREQIHGCLLIGKLQTYIDYGVAPVAKSADRIIQAINTVFYRHLCNWIIYGDLVDTCNEFFIGDANCADENFLYPEQLRDSETNTIEIFHDSFKKHKVKQPAIVRKFYLRTEMIPPIISLETAETILFIGRVVWIVRNDPKRYSDDRFQLKFKRDVWEGKDSDYYRKLQALEGHPINLAVFDKTIEECRLKLTKYLWKIMVEEANLLNHLQLIRDYYALGRGELFQQFIIAAEDHLKETPTDYIITNLNFIFAETARKLYTDNDKTYLCFELSLPRTLEKSADDDSNPWTRLEINFDVKWPLHILFHPKAMSLYNKLFCFLLRVKKTHIDLHKVWLSHMEGKPKIDPKLWTLRNNLMFIVNNLQYYLQVDVIEAQFSILKNAVQNANEFEDIIRLHSIFLKNLLNKTFVSVAEEPTKQETNHTLYQIPALKYEENSLVYKTILEILRLCDEFCLTVSSWDYELTELEQNELLHLKNNSDVLIEKLLHLLYSLHEKSSGHHLLQLLHHIDFNRWFSKNNADLNLTVAY